MKLRTFHKNSDFIQLVSSPDWKQNSLFGCDVSWLSIAQFLSISHIIDHPFRIISLKLTFGSTIGRFESNLIDQKTKKASFKLLKAYHVILMRKLIKIVEENDLLILIISLFSLAASFGLMFVVSICKVDFCSLLLYNKTLNPIVQAINWKRTWVEFLNLTFISHSTNCCYPWIFSLIFFVNWSINAFTNSMQFLIILSASSCLLIEILSQSIVSVIDQTHFRLSKNILLESWTCKQSIHRFNDDSTLFPFSTFALCSQSWKLKLQFEIFCIH